MLELCLIPLALCTVNCQKFTFSFWMYSKTVAESLHKHTRLIFSFSSAIGVFNFGAKIAACSSSLGIVFFMGVFHGMYPQTIRGGD